MPCVSLFGRVAVFTDRVKLKEWREFDLWLRVGILGLRYVSNSLGFAKGYVKLDYVKSTIIEATDGKDYVGLDKVI